MRATSALSAAVVLFCSLHAAHAARPTAPAPSPAASPATALVAEVNAARAVARSCGTTAFAAAPALKATNIHLNRVTQAQAQSMASSGSLAHPGQNTARLAAGGYPATVALDLVAGDSGSGTAATTVAGWIASPAHCAVLMDPQFVDLGVGYAENNASSTVFKHFWVAMFAKP